MKRTVSAILALILCFAVGCTAAGAQAETVAQKEAPGDVDTGTAAGAAIEQMVNRGVISPVSDGQFEPNAPISAGDYVVMLAKLRGLAPASSGTSEEDRYMHAALDAHWYDWDQIPPDNPAGYKDPITRELAANILMAAFFGTVQYNWSVHTEITDFSDVSGRYYTGVLGGLTLGLFDQQSGTPFYPKRSLTRAEACLWAANAEAKAENPGSTPSARPSPTTQSPSQSPEPSEQPGSPSSAPAGGGVRQNGWLQVKGTQLCNEAGAPVVLHGMSSMGIQWFPQYTNIQSIRNTVDRGANIFRIAMYTEAGGYLSDKPKYKALVEEIVQNAVDLDIYVIIDWHILSDGNPMSHLDEALVFFREMSEKYADTPNVIYEICNEPNGNITWAADVKPYAEQVVAEIRKNSERGIILIGNPMWDQDVDIAAADPVSGTNLMYTLHFYAGTHHQALRDKATKALSLGAPIFVSEWGTSDASGTGGVYIESSDQWLEYMKDRRISWCNWSLCDKDETSAALVPGAPSDSSWTEADLSESGKYVFARFRDGMLYPQVTPSPSPSAPRPEAAKSVTADEAAALFRGLPGCETVIRKGSTVLKGDDIVSTGCTAEAISAENGEVLRKETIIVKGDVQGTGVMNLSQLVRMAQAVSGTKPLEGIYLEAGELDGRPGAGLTDLVREARLLTDGGRLTCTFAAA